MLRRWWLFVKNRLSPGVLFQSGRTVWNWALTTGWALTGPLLLSAVFLIWCWPGLRVPPVNPSNPHALYLLSAIAQSLAAVLALVFTISLVIAQLFSRYSQRMLDRLLDVPTILYILLFIASVSFTFWLHGDPEPWGVKLSLTLAVALLLFLLPYFFSLRNKLNPEWLLSKLRAGVSKELQGDPFKEPQTIVTLDNFVLSAFAFKDYDTFEKGIKALAALILEAYSLGSDSAGDAFLSLLNMSDETGDILIRRLSNIGMVTFKDPRAPFLVLEILGDSGITAAEKRLTRAGRSAIEALQQIFFEATERRMQPLAFEAISVLGKVGNHAATEGINVQAEFAAVSLYETAIVSSDKGLQSALSEAISSMGRIGIIAIEKRWHENPPSVHMVLDESMSGGKDLASWIIDKVWTLGCEAVEKGQKRNATAAAESLWKMGARAIEANAPQIETAVVSGLKELEQKGGILMLNAAYEQAKQSWMLGGVIPMGSEALEKFKDKYQQK